MKSLISTSLHAATPPHILLREALQFENTGDSGRVPGTMVTLWPLQLHEREMLTRAFPKLRLASGEVDEAGKASTPARPAKTFQVWAMSGRPYGFFGSHFDPVSSRKDRPQGDTLDELQKLITALSADHLDGHYKSREVYDGAAFICVLPRLRYTPYYRVKNLPRDEGDYELDAINAEHAARAKVDAAMQQGAAIQKRMIQAIADAVAKHHSKPSR